MASPLLASTYCSPACLHSRTQPQPSVATSGSILPKPVAALINKRPTPFSAVYNKSLARPSISFSMSRRTRSPVIAKVSQTESKPNSKQEGGPPEDNFYVVVTLCLTPVLKHLRKHHVCMQCLTSQQHSQELHKLPLHDSLHSSVPAILQACWYASYITMIKKSCHVQASVAAAMATGVANRVLYKMALVPMGNYVFVLSQFQTFGYLLVYFGILATRYRSAFPWSAQTITLACLTLCMQICNR